MGLEISGSDWRTWTSQVHQNPDGSYTATCNELGIEYTRASSGEAERALLAELARRIVEWFEQHPSDTLGLDTDS